MTVPVVTFRQRIGRFLTPFVLARARFTRGMTFGVRLAAIDGGRVFLVQHGYVPGWYLPGGAVDLGESAGEAAAREAMEEGRIQLHDSPTLFGLYHNREASRTDHVALFVAGAFSVLGPRPPDREIAACGFFPLNALPEDTTAATRRRLDEIAGRRAPDPLW